MYIVATLGFCYMVFEAVGYKVYKYPILLILMSIGIASFSTVAELGLENVQGKYLKLVKELKSKETISGKISEEKLNLFENNKKSLAELARILQPEINSIPSLLVEFEAASNFLISAKSSEEARVHRVIVASKSNDILDAFKAAKELEVATIDVAKSHENFLQEAQNKKEITAKKNNNSEWILKFRVIESLFRNVISIIAGGLVVTAIWMVILRSYHRKIGKIVGEIDDLRQSIRALQKEKDEFPAFGKTKEDGDRITRDLYDAQNRLYKKEEKLKKLEVV